ncbi:MAG TPA: hypothetical protein PLY75_00470 [Gammaproteobacteria bacterium]|nr:hypothetical protein [Chromatiales bacterium]HPQ23375.1 hypothetical protein [Gammaproteobacteria bacterium]
MVSTAWIRMLAFASLCWGLGGCASFNDSVTVDIGDQFDLLAVDVAAGAGGSRHLHGGEGFECVFDARSERVAWFGRERHVSGSIRCHYIGTPDPDPAGGEASAQ